MPIYLKLMGAEAFGLVGFYLMLQAWLQILDLGLSPTFSREMSLFKAGIINAAAAWQRLRSLEWLLTVVAITIVTTIIILKNKVASDWLTVKHLSTDDVAICITLMAITAALRWLMGLYRSGLIGLEQQSLVNGAGILFITLKFVGVLPLLVYWSASPKVFFEYQTFIGIMELLTFLLFLYRALPGSSSTLLPSWSAFQAMLPIAGAMAFMSGVWIVTTQTDKLILSKVLSLEEYGNYTIAIALAGGLLSLIIPLNQVLQPRMTVLVAQKKLTELHELYRQMTQLITALFFALGGTLALFAEPILYAWTGNSATAQTAAPILLYYGLANAFIGALALPFMLQFAHGYLRLHVIGNLIMSTTLLPALIYASIHYGGVGAGSTLLAARFLFILLWIPLVHRRLIPDIIWKWPLYDVGKVAIAIFIFLLAAHKLLPQIENRMLSVFMLGCIFFSGLLVGLLTGNYSRRHVVGLIGKII